MTGALTGWIVTFRGCEQAREDCDSARFEVMPPHSSAVAVEVRTTAQIEQILARELGEETLDASEREAILSVAGRHVIEECLEKHGRTEPLLFLDSRLFRVPGAERRLLRECSLLLE